MSLEMPSWFAFLKIETQLAMTFIEVARSSAPETSTRNLANARKALATIQRGLKEPVRHGLSGKEVTFLQLRCDEIELALAAV